MGKPFGKDLESCQAMERIIRPLWFESETFRTHMRLFFGLPLRLWPRLTVVQQASTTALVRRW